MFLPDAFRVSSLEALGNNFGDGFPGPSLRSDPGLRSSDRWSFGIGLARAVVIFPVPFLQFSAVKAFLCGEIVFMRRSATRILTVCAFPRVETPRLPS
jgi:hypothetical protein